MRRKQGLWILCGILVLTFWSGCAEEDSSPASGPEVPACVEGVFSERILDDVTDDTFKNGPYLMQTTTDSTVIMWESTESCFGEIAYGTSPDALDNKVSHEGESQIHSVRLENLQPDTRYYYTASACDKTTETLSFWTALKPGSPTIFTVWGDSRSYPERAQMVVESMKPHNPHFNLHTGDVVTNGKEEEQWTDEFFDPLRTLGHSVPTFIALGNHEKNSEHFYKRVDYPKPLPGTATNGSMYSLSYGNVFLLVINTNGIFFPIDIDPENVIENEVSLWIREQMASEAAQKATWRIAAGHEPGYSESWSPGSCHYDGNAGVRDWFMPLLAEHHFHAYFAGHTHTYERGMVNGVLHVISGGGGAGLDDWCVDFQDVTVMASVFHYLVIKAGCNTLTMEAFYAPGAITPFDAVTLKADQWGAVVDEMTDLTDAENYTDH